MKYLKYILLTLVTLVSIGGISYGATTVLYPYGGGTGVSQPPIGLIYSSGGNNPMTSTSSPTVGYLTATSTTATSTFAGGLQAGGSTGLYVLQNGYVGIGGSSPFYPLSVITAADNLGLQIRRNSASTGSTNEIGFRIASTEGSSLSGIRASRTDGGAGHDLKFFTNTSGNNPTVRMVIDNLGNVGIATDTPSTKLQVNGNGSPLSIKRSTAGAGNLYFDLRNASDTEIGYFGYGSSSNNKLTLANLTGENINFYNGGIAMSIDSSQQVGIGTEAPSATLDVHGSMAIYGATGITNPFKWYNTDNTNFAMMKSSVSGATQANVAFYVTGNNPDVTIGNQNAGNTLSVTVGTTSPYSTMTLEEDNLAATVATSSGLTLQNFTPAINGTQQNSPVLRLIGQGFASTGGLSQTDSFWTYVQPVQGTTVSTANYIIASSINNGQLIPRFTLTNGGSLTLTSNLSAGSTITATGGYRSTATALATSTQNNSADGLRLTNTTAATLNTNAQQSPRIYMEGKVWDGTASRMQSWDITNLPFANGSRYTSATSTLQFNYAYSGLGTTTMLQLDSGGHVGIGTTSPYATLSVVGDGGIVADSINATSTTATSTFAGNIATNGYLQVASSSNIYYGWVKPTLWTTPSASQNATANQWQCEQFELPVQKQIVGITYVMNNAVAGNVAAAIFRPKTFSDFTQAILEASTASTALVASTSISDAMTVPIATTTIQAGEHYACLQWDSANVGYLRGSNGAFGPRSVLLPPGTGLMGAYSTTTFATFFTNTPGFTSTTTSSQPSILIKLIQ